MGDRKMFLLGKWLQAKKVETQRAWRGQEPQPRFRRQKNVGQKNDRCGRPHAKIFLPYIFLPFIPVKGDRG